MSLFVVAPDLDLTLEVPIAPDALESISRYLAAVRDGWEHDNFCNRLALEFGRVVPDVIDWQFKPPTKAQLAFARSICRRLEIPMPTDVISGRGEMHRFLEFHSARLRG